LLFDGSPFYFAVNWNARSYDVVPGDQRFVFMRNVAPTGPADMLVQVTNWAAEVQTKLAGKAPK
jgi:hypothetical protein